LTGAAPFMGASMTELAIRIATERPPTARTLRRDIPIGLEQAILRCLEKERVDRFQDVGQLATTLREFGSAKASISVERVLAVVQRGGTPAGVSLSNSNPVSAMAETVPWGPTEPNARPARSKSRVAAVAVGAALLIGVLGTGGVLASRRYVRPASQAAAATSATLAVTAATQETIAPAEALSSAPPSASVAVVASAASAAPTSEPRGHAHRAMSASPLPSQSAAPPTDAPASCDTPYFFDARGNRVFKPECL
jgi:hypothetical protein